MPLKNFTIFFQGVVPSGGAACGETLYFPPLSTANIPIEYIQFKEEKKRIFFT